MKKEKINANTVGATIGRPHFVEETKKTKGITLIALIITIIVMLILVGVTVATISDGGLLQKAKKAAEQMQIKADEEELLSAVMAAMGTDRKVDFSYLDKNLPTGWLGANGRYTSPKGNTYTVDADGKITYIGKRSDLGVNDIISNFNIELNQKYNAITNTVNITIVPTLTLTEDMFTEEEAIEILGNMLNEELGTNYPIKTLEELIVLFYYGGEPGDNTYENVVDEITIEMENKNPTEQEVFAYIIGDPDMTVQLVAVGIYQDAFEYMEKTLRINGTDVTEQAKWENDIATYVVLEDGTYEIELEVDGKSITKPITVTSISNENNGNWVDNGDGTYTRGDTTVKVGETTITNEEVKRKLGATGGTYTGTWTVIGVEGDKLKLVSTRNVENKIRLGCNDPRAIEAIPAVNESAPTETEKFERAVYSYENAIDTLNNVVQTETGITSARSITVEDIYDIVGEENIDKSDHTYELYGARVNFYYDATTSTVHIKLEKEGWEEPIITNKSSLMLLDEEGDRVVIDSKGDQVTLTLNYYSGNTLSREQIGNLATESFWLASTCRGIDSSDAYYYVRHMYYGSLEPGNFLFNSSGWYFDDYNSIIYGARAVISI